MLTIKDHEDLYAELHEVLYDRSKSIEVLTEAQRHFVEAFESAAFGAEFLECYSDLIDGNPAVTLRNLHSFCLGHSLGLRNGDKVKIDLSKKYH